MYIYFNGNIEYLSPNAFKYATNISNTNTYSNARYLGDTNNQYSGYIDMMVQAQML